MQRILEREGRDRLKEKQINIRRGQFRLINVGKMWEKNFILILKMIERLRENEIN